MQALKGLRGKWLHSLAKAKYFYRGLPRQDIPYRARFHLVGLPQRQILQTADGIPDGHDDGTADGEEDDETEQNRGDDTDSPEQNH